MTGSLIGRKALAGLLGACVAIVGGSALAKHGGSHGAANQTSKAEARLFGQTSMKGFVRYEDRTRNNARSEQRIRVHINRAEPNQDYPVILNDTLQIGVVHTNAGGAGKLDLRSRSGHGHGNNALLNMPAVHTGDMVTIGTSMGIFFDRNRRGTQTVSVQGSITGGSGITGEVEYKERFRNGSLVRCLDVELEGASPGESFDISINGVVYGTLITDAEGKGELAFKSNETDDGEDDLVLPMPSTFPTLHAGDLVNIGGLSATLGNDDDGGDDDHQAGNSGGDDDDDDQGEDD
jgi:hypothetical protein